MGAERAGEPISPELVLVDPALRRRAALLPDPTWTRSPHGLPDREAARRAATVDFGTAHAAARSWRRPVLVAASLAGLIVAPLALERQEGERRSSPPPETTVPARTHTKPERTVPTRTVPTRTAPTRAAPAVERPSRRSRAPESPKRRARRPLPASSSCAVISWKPAPGATGYDVILWRDGRRLRDLWPRGARAPIAETWTRHGRRQRLRPGRYLWFVYPLTKRRGKQSAGKLRAYGALVVARGAAPCTERARVESTVAD